MGTDVRVPEISPGQLRSVEETVERRGAFLTRFTGLPLLSLEATLFGVRGFGFAPTDHGRRAFRDRYERNKRRLGKQRGAKVAQLDIARQISDAIWHMLTRNQPFAPASAKCTLAA